MLSIDCTAFNLKSQSSKPQLSPTVVTEVQRIAKEFTLEFLRTSDISSLYSKYFVKDFMERYNRAKAGVLPNNLSSTVHLVPGLFYELRLLNDASREDWLRLYSAANNFFLFGTAAGIKAYKNKSGIEARDLYPASVVELLNTNPNLSNMILRKSRSKDLSSVSEMRAATTVLEKAVSIMRDTLGSKPLLELDEKEFSKALEEDDFFKPKVELIDQQFFDFPKGTQMIFINTPVMFRLMLVKSKEKIEILWAEPYVEG